MAAAERQSPASSEASKTPAPILLAGPTAAGKSEVALLLAERLNGEIVTVDSMQVYRGLDIGTAKPTPAEQARVRHHLIDVAALDEPFDAARFVALAAAAVQDIQSRLKRPIFCGGTGLYFKAYLEGLGEAPPSDAALRTELEATPLDALLRELQERDAITFERIDRQNPRRVVRAIEVIRLTGKPFSEQRADWVRPEASAKAPSGCSVFALSRNAEDLRRRVDGRVDRMFEAGLVAETDRLLRCGLAENKTAMQAIGYRQVVEHLRGERSLEETVALIKQRTRHFAKRQLTWFRRQLSVHWIEVGVEETAAAIAHRIEGMVGRDSVEP